MVELILNLKKNLRMGFVKVFGLTCGKGKCDCENWFGRSLILRLQSENVLIQKNWFNFGKW